MSYSIDTNFIDEIGQAIYDIYANDPNQSEWLKEITDSYTNNDYQFPEGTLNTIKDYFESHNADNIYSDLLNKILIIENNEDEENLLSAIFFPNSSNVNEEEEEAPMIPLEEEEDEVEDNDSPMNFFKNILNTTQTTLCISPDIVYLLLKKYGWNKDIALTQWFDSQEEIFKSLRLKIGSQMVPNLQSPLDFKECETAQCPLCHKKAQLLQLYCGHKICRDCLNSELETQINQGKLPFCRQLTDDHKECNAEIIIKTYEDHVILEKYKKALLKDKLENNRIDVKACPNPRCGYFINQFDKISKNLGRCSRCNAITCIRCAQGAHAPLQNCSKVDEFCHQIPLQMCQLLLDQEKWEKREVRLSDHRCQNNGEVKKGLDDLVKNYSKEQNNDISNEKTKLQNYSANITRMQKEIEDIKKTLRESMNDPKVRSEIPQLSRKILALRQEIEKNERDKADYTNTISKNDESRKFKLDSIKKENILLVEGLTNSETYQKKISEYHQFLLEHSYSSVNALNLDIENIELQSEICPKCKSKILRFVGLSQMQCSCGFKLCKACKKKWDDEHNRTSVCPKYLTEITKHIDSKSKSKCGINFDDLNDKKFYPPPMSFDKCCEYVLFGNYYAMFLHQKEVYNYIITEFCNPDEKLCKRGKLIHALQQTVGLSEATSIAEKLISTALFTQSMMIWVYPTLYFLLKEDNVKRANFIRKELLNLNANSTSLIVAMKNPSPSQTTKFFSTEMKRIENQYKEFIEKIEDY